MAEDAPGGTVPAGGPRGGRPDPAVAAWATEGHRPAVRARLPRPWWAALAGAVALLLVGALSVAWSRNDPGDDPVAAGWHAAATPDRPTLREYAPHTVRIGTAVNARMLDDPAYRAVLASDFTAVTAENAMKWQVLQPTPGRYDWTAADRIVGIALDNGQAVYGHTLVWHSGTPAWVSESWPREKLRALLREHVTTVVSRYRGKVWAWDVVNEALADDGSLRDTIWLRRLGPGYIADAFRWAHQADPDARLFINEYDTEGRTRKAHALWQLVHRLRADGVPIQGVGFQSHLRASKPPQDMTGNLRRFAALGVAVAVTELDVRVPQPVTPEKLASQALMYQYVLGACLAVPTCESFTVWGFTDASSWIPHRYPGYDSACLFDSTMRPKPAHSALVTELRTHPPASPG
ncbi:endo-1,4-beta-xylanase [Micromonospora mirobrigensis]|uniref:Beta-xylanase n=1 Tax=Micromonospora mirobrigensis TaxID=262898 RepID=A0A1C4U977_9ACTN|nr:endo-1,4-beta-xylanase [Micromonospora mirobrigensis]SCE68258.1 endo-1,4-beta-xylanase [Micromonospora mirobrigensis]